MSNANDADRRVVRKVDLILMPILTITLGLQYYDKAVLGNAAVFGILKDLDLTQTINGVTSTQRYSTATAAFYYGYIVAVLPMALIFARFPLARTAAILVLLWGITCLLTVVCHNYPGFTAQRFALGLAESSVSPAFVAITALWYKPSEQVVRFGIWYSATGIFSMFSGLLNFGLGHAPVASPWKALYYFCGSVTIAWAFVIWFFLPTSPLEPGRFFNEAEKEILRRRFQEYSYTKDRQKLDWSQAKETFTDFKTGIYFLMATSIYICNGSITAFGARIISGFGYDSLTTTALLIPGGAVTCVTIYLFTFLSGRFRDSRTILLPVSCIPVVVGALVIWLAPLHPTAGPLIGYYLVASFGAPYVLLLAISSANTAGATKKALTSGVIFIGYNVGNIASAYLVIAKEMPIRYRSTWISVIVGMAVASACSILLRFWFIQENKKRSVLDNAAKETDTRRTNPADGGLADIKTEDPEVPVDTLSSPLVKYVDRTEKHIPRFQYSL